MAPEKSPTKIFAQYRHSHAHNGYTSVIVLRTCEACDLCLVQHTQNLVLNMFKRFEHLWHRPNICFAFALVTSSAMQWSLSPLYLFSKPVLYPFVVRVICLCSLLALYVLLAGKFVLGLVQPCFFPPWRWCLPCTSSMVGLTRLVDELNKLGGIGTAERLLANVGDSCAEPEDTTRVVLRGLVKVAPGMAECGWKTHWNQEAQVLLQYDELWTCSFSAVVVSLLLSLNFAIVVALSTVHFCTLALNRVNVVAVTTVLVFHVAWIRHHVPC